VAEVRTIAVIGAGAPGRRIAQRSAVGGFRTILEDILPASLRKAENAIRAALDTTVESGAMPRGEAEAALARIEYAGSIEQAARAADLIIEAAPEEMESKLEIIILLDKLARPATIVASTTSVCNIAELAAVTYRAKKILGMRFSEEGIQIVRARETDEETVTACAEVGRRMGGRVVVREELVSG